MTVLLIYQKEILRCCNVMNSTITLRTNCLLDFVHRPDKIRNIKSRLFGSWFFFRLQVMGGLPKRHDFIFYPDDGKVQKTIGSQYYIPSSEPFGIYSIIGCLQYVTRRWLDNPLSQVLYLAGCTSLSVVSLPFPASQIVQCFSERTSGNFSWFRSQIKQGVWLTTVHAIFMAAYICLHEAVH
jgi:hypothetical protein